MHVEVRHLLMGGRAGIGEDAERRGRLRRPLDTAQVPHDIAGRCEIVNYVLAMIEQCQTAIRGFSAFPAGSLPRRRFLPYVVRKFMIARSFSARGEP
jgi:hypothetical protein